MTRKCNDRTLLKHSNVRTAKVLLGVKEIEKENKLIIQMTKLSKLTSVHSAVFQRKGVTEI